MPERHHAQRTTGPPQAPGSRRDEAAAALEPVFPPSAREVLSSPGAPVAHPALMRIARRMGAPAEQIRIHDGPLADNAARELGALAFAHGHHLVFSGGRYAPESADGQALFAHEVAHVVQQRRGGPDAAGAPAMDQAADAAARAAVGGADPVSVSGSASTGVARQAVAGAAPVQLYNLRIGPEVLENATEAQVKEALGRVRRRIQASLAGDEAGHQYVRELREEQYIVGTISAALGGAWLPPESIWQPAHRALDTAADATARGDINGAIRALIEAERTWREAHVMLQDYIEGTISGAGRAVTGLEFTRDASFMVVGVAATAVAGPVGGALIGTGVSALGNVAQQGMEVQLGLRKKIDWAGIGFDAAMGLVTSAIGGKFGSSVVGRLAKYPQFARLGQPVLKRVVTNLLSGRASAVLQTTARSIFDQLRGEGQPLTGEEFLSRIAHTLTDPRGMFFDLVGGELGHRLPPRAAGSRPPPAESGAGPVRAAPDTTTAPPPERTAAPAAEAPAAPIEAAAPVAEAPAPAAPEAPPAAVEAPTPVTEAPSGPAPEPATPTAAESNVRRFPSERARPPGSQPSGEPAQVIDLAQRRKAAAAPPETVPPTEAAAQAIPEMLAATGTEGGAPVPVEPAGAPRQPQLEVIAGGRAPPVEASAGGRGPGSRAVGPGGSRPGAVAAPPAPGTRRGPGRGRRGPREPGSAEPEGTGLETVTERERQAGLDEQTRERELLKSGGARESVAGLANHAEAVANGVPPEILGDSTVLLASDFPEVQSSRRARDIARESQGSLPEPLPLTEQTPSGQSRTRPVGGSNRQNIDVQGDAALLAAAGCTEVRINQQQTTAGEGATAVGTNRPDVQGTLPNGRRVHIEYDRAPPSRALAHAKRILANDPTAIVILKVVGFEGLVENPVIGSED